MLRFAAAPVLKLPLTVVNSVANRGISSPLSTPIDNKSILHTIPTKNLAVRQREAELAAKSDLLSQSYLKLTTRRTEGPQAIAPRRQVWCSSPH